MNVVLVESHPLLRIAMLTLLESIAGIAQAVAIDPGEIPEHLHAGGAVDLIVFGMPADAGTGWQWLGQARRLWAAPRVLLLCDAVPLQLPQGEITEGFCGCLPKSAPLDVLRTAIRRIATRQPERARASQLSLFPALPALPLAALAPRPAAGSQRLTREATQLGLTQRQYDVLALLSRGHAVKTVGRLLNISAPTVKTHARAMYRHLQVAGKEEAAHKARQQGFSLAWPVGGVPALTLARRHAPAVRQMELL
ncbi:DNA-binding response regulator [Cupriavidus basilensis]|uniref:Response regulator transcription factor n=1 Tax=Cupriavidus basilensis TaxID=68895 RepID=A0A643FNY0_9BURK|nr:LuxR C-terminal-related transcriptional regulator [Cupriavidus basilensis]QOT79299.1 response regulator transcription factor [Cupriavidus basilensis]